MDKEAVFGALSELMNNLSGDDAHNWEAELIKFVQKKGCWGGENHSILSLLSGGQSVMIDATDGSELLSKASDVFSWIDSDFKNYGANEKKPATDATAVDVYQMEQDGDFAKMFLTNFSLSLDERNKLCLTQGQIKNFVKKHRNWLRKEGYATFFLFESKGEYFVAYVYFYSDGKLGVGVNRFEGSNGWNAGDRHRVVVPRLA